MPCPAHRFNATHKPPTLASSCGGHPPFAHMRLRRVLEGGWLLWPNPLADPPRGVEVREPCLHISDTPIKLFRDCLCAPYLPISQPRAERLLLPLTCLRLLLYLHDEARGRSDTIDRNVRLPTTKRAWACLFHKPTRVINTISFIHDQDT